MWFNSPTGKVNKATLTSIIEKIIDRLTREMVSTVPTQKLRAELAIRSVYRLANQPEPERIVWFASPFAALVALATILKGKPIPTKFTPPETLEYTKEIEAYLRDARFDDALNTAKEQFGQINFDRAIDGICKYRLKNLIKEHNYQRDPDLPSTMAIENQIKGAWRARLEPELPRSVHMAIPRLLIQQRIDFDCTESKSLMVEMRQHLPQPSYSPPFIDVQTDWKWRFEVKQLASIVWKPVQELLRSELNRVLTPRAQNPARSLLFESVELYSETITRLASYELAQIANRSVPSGFVDLKGMIELGWMFPFKSVAIAVERPKILQLDSHNRPHADFGNAIEYNDGWTCWMWHGVPVRIPETDMDWRPGELIPEDYYGL